MIDTTNAELKLEISPTGLVKTTVRGIISFYCDTTVEGELKSVSEVPEAAKAALKRCIQDVIYKEPIELMLALHSQSLSLVEYDSAIYKHLKEQFDRLVDLLRLHNLPFSEDQNPYSP